ncbi:MAG TPA: cupredoxin domain-containing protein [Acidimicrobiales bacterium]|nr:cupredoxin domain-containing protein [Acidimicrobiales bacterium]
MLLCLAAAAPMGVAAAQSAPASNTIVNFEFTPTTMTVASGTTITWTNTADRPHTVTDRGGTFDNLLAPGTTSSISFTVPGTYHYFCRINPSKMNGVIVVNPGPQPAPTNRVEALDPAREGESLRFLPNNLTAEAGSTVLFANVGGKPHTLTADDGSFDTGVVAPGAEGGRFAGTNATFTLSKPGTYTFHCEIHPAVMKGTLTVTGTAREGPAPPSAAPTAASVDMVDFAFKPPQASVAPGGKVTWKNKGAAQHTASFDDVALDTKVVAPGAQAELTAPDKPGSYSYRCNIHPAKMRGVLVVVGQNTDDPTRKVATEPASYAGTSGPGTGVSTVALVTLGIGAFLGGAGIMAFIRRPRSAT